MLQIALDEALNDIFFQIHSRVELTEMCGESASIDELVKA